jgi:lipoprotein-releasing system permease protein
MYAALLSNRYLTSRVIPLIAVGAVALCVALVIIVVSVMSGFLDMLKASGRTLIGDVIVSSGIGGIPHYDEWLTDLRALPEVEEATPVIDTLGLLRMPYPSGPSKEIAPVQVWAIEPASFARVTAYGDKVWWRPPADEDARNAMLPDDPRLLMDESILRDGLTLSQGATGKPGIVMGMHVSVGNARQSDGSYRPRFGWFMPGEEVTLTVVPVSESGKISEPRDATFPIVNEVFSGVYDVDKSRVFIPLAQAQQLLRLDAAPLYDTTAEPDAEGNLPLLGTTPARVTKVLIRAKPGIDALVARDAVEASWDAFVAKAARRSDRLGRPPERVSILTWEQQLRDLIGPVEKEREMMRILFSIIYIVCAGLILWIFLRYGLAIGVVGSLAGVGIAWVVVDNINLIHEAIGRDAPRAAWITTCALAAISLAMALRSLLWRGRLLPGLLWTIATVTLAVVTLALLGHRGTLIWDPSVYYFSRIPSQVDWFNAAITVGGGIVFSVIGAAIPAAKAADVDPVEALRYG